MWLFKPFSRLLVPQVRLYCREIPRTQLSISRLKKIGQYEPLLESLVQKYEDLLTQPNIPMEAWENFRKSMLESEYVNPVFIDTLIMDLCETKENIDAVMSYYKYLEHNNYNPPITLQAKYLETCGMKAVEISEADKDQILNVCKSIADKYPIMDDYTANACIVGLCSIGEWKTSIDIIKRQESYDSIFLSAGYNALINCLFNCGQIELAYEYLNITFMKAVGPSNHVYKTYLKYCLQDKHTFDEKIQKMFLLWRKFDIKPHVDVISEFIDVCNQQGWNADTTVVNCTQCEKCGEKLSEPNLTEEEFHVLASRVMKKLIVEKGYLATKPTEVKHFAEFIDKIKPYDVVIDSLNVMYYKTGPQLRLRCDVLTKLILYFQRKLKRVVVIGRQHLLRSVEIRNLTKKAHFFFLNDVSKDDAFILYAALAGGRDTIIISGDLMRQHKFALKDIELSVMFKRWQYLHQYKYDNNSLSPLRETEESGIECIAQQQGLHWHVPFQRFLPTSRNNRTNSDDWACFKMCK